MNLRATVAILIGVLLAGSVSAPAFKSFSCPRPLAVELCNRLAGADIPPPASGTVSRVYNRSSLIRLHIMANSNDPGDQEVKYRVRDAIVATFRPELLCLQSRSQAEALLAANQDQIARLAEQVIASNGFCYPARVEIGNFDFPTRAYGDLVLPAGNYRAVRLILGQGAGANWWCVLYPPLCFVDVTGAGNPGAALADGPGLQPQAREEMSPVSGGDSVRLKLKILNWLETGSDYLARLL